jgi:hypothetical protein
LGFSGLSTSFFALSSMIPILTIACVLLLKKQGR